MAPLLQEPKSAGTTGQGHHKERNLKKERKKRKIKNGCTPAK